MAKENTTQEVLGTATLNTRKGSVANAKADLDYAILLLDPRNNQVVEVEQQHTHAFLEEAATMSDLLDALIKAKEDIAKAQGEIAKANSDKFSRSTRDLETKLSKARTAYEKARSALSEKMGESYIAGSGKELLELVPIAKAKGKDASRKVAPYVGRKWTYVRSDKVKNHTKSYDLGNKAADKESIVKNGKIDSQKLMDGFSKLEGKVKADWKVGTGGVVFPELQKWAEALNGSKELKGDRGDTLVKFDYEAQLFRYFAGAAAEATWDPKGGKISAGVSAKSEINLAKGEAKMSAFFPNENGWSWADYGVVSGKEYLIGHVRGNFTVKLESGAGASFAAELAVEVESDALTGKTLIKGTRLNKSRSTSQPTKVNTKDTAAGTKLEGDLFAGVKAAGDIKGALEFKNPEKNGDFEALASVGSALGVSAGAGGGGALMVDFNPATGKFKIHAKAALCIGVGAKGAFDFEVNAKQISSFLECLCHANNNANYERVEWIGAVGFRAYTQAGVMITAGVKDAETSILKSWLEFNKTIEIESYRAELANKILSNPRQLRFNSPEAQGILIYHLTRHGKMTYLDLRNHSFDGFDTEVFGTRKAAIIKILSFAQSKRHFENIVQHISPTGGKGVYEVNYAGLTAYLAIGPGKSDYIYKLKNIHTQLAYEPPRGYPIEANDSPAYTLFAASESTQYLASMENANSAAATSA